MSSLSSLIKICYSYGVIYNASYCTIYANKSKFDDVSNKIKADWILKRSLLFPYFIFREIDHFYENRRYNKRDRKWYIIDNKPKEIPSWLPFEEIDRKDDLDLHFYRKYGPRKYYGRYGW